MILIKVYIDDNLLYYYIEYYKYKTFKKNNKDVVHHDIYNKFI